MVAEGFIQFQQADLRVRLHRQGTIFGRVIGRHIEADQGDARGS